MLFLCFPLTSLADTFTATPEYFGKLADAIYWAEGGEKAKSPYGLIYYKNRTKAEYRKLCLYHLERYYHLWVKQGSHGNFIYFLGSYWAPVVNVSSSHIGYNKNWVKNVNYFMKHPKSVI